MSKQTKRNNILIILMCLVTLVSFSFFNTNVKAEGNESYTITYELNGGTNDPSNPSTYDGSKDITLKDPTKTGYTFKGWEVVLDGYTPLEYLKSTGGQYINTGIYPTASIKSEITYKYNVIPTQGADSKVMGCFINDGGYHNYYVNSIYSQGMSTTYIGIGKAPSNYNYSSDTEKHTATLIAGEPCKYIFDDSGEKIISESTWNGKSFNTPIYLFAASYDNSPLNHSEANIYSFKAWEGDTLIRYMMPVKRNDGVFGMYDLAENKFYTNAGSGTFEASSDPISILASTIYKGSKGNRKFSAKWEANKYNVTLDSQGGTGGSNSVQVTYDADIPSITVPTRDKYLFKGYYDQATGGTKYINPDGTSAKKWDKASDTTLYAQWEEITATPSKTSSSVAIGCTDTISFTFNPSSISSTAVFKSIDNTIVNTSYTNNVLTITGKKVGTTSIQVFADAASKEAGTPILATINVTVIEKPQPIIEPGDMPYDETNGFKVEFTKGITSTATAHISGASKSDFKSVTKNGKKLTEGTDYEVKEGSIKVVFKPSYLNNLSPGTHVLNIKVNNSDYKVTITVDNPSKPAPSPGKDESCEKVIGPTWHWNNKKGICEDSGSVNTHVR